MCFTWLWRWMPRRVRGEKPNYYTFILPNKVNTELNFSATWPLRSQAASLWVKFWQDWNKVWSRTLQPPQNKAIGGPSRHGTLRSLGILHVCAVIPAQSHAHFFVCKLFGIELCVVHFPSWEKRHFIQITRTFTCSGVVVHYAGAVCWHVVAVWHQDSPVWKSAQLFIWWGNAQQQGL